MDPRLCSRLIQEMEIRGFSDLTIKAYLASIEMLAGNFCGRLPKTVSLEELKAFQHHLLKEKKLAPATTNRHIAAIRFLYAHVLENEELARKLPLTKIRQRIPTILSESEVARMIDSTHKVMYKAIIMLMYSAGLRASELINLKAHHIDSERKVINIYNGKGQKDRQTILSEVALSCLRLYWRLYRRNADRDSWLFVPTNPSSAQPGGSLSHTALCNILVGAARRAGLFKKVTPHVLRYSFTVHLIERGVNLRHVQYLLGHRSISTTVKYAYVADIKTIKVTSPLDALLNRIGQGTP